MLTKEALELIIATASATVSNQAECAPHLVHHKDMVTTPLEKYLHAPLFVTRSQECLTVDSFVDYTNRFANKNSVLFINKRNSLFVSHFNFHNAESGVEIPSWDKHASYLALRESRQWKLWTSLDKKWMTQLEFADFIEDNISDFNNPSGAEMLEVATKFYQTKKVVFGSGVRLASGEVQFQYSNENEKGSITVPESFAIAIPVYEYFDRIRISARLRHRANDERGLEFQIRINEVDEIQEQAFDLVATKVKSRLALVPYFEGVSGAPKQS